MAKTQMSVVMGVLNGEDTIHEQLEAVLGQITDFDFELIVVDHGSSDGTVSIIEQLASVDTRLNLIDGSHLRRGGAAPKNFGALQARADRIAFCDADDVVRPKWLQALYEGLMLAPIAFARFEYWSLNPRHVRRHRPQYTNEQGGGAFGIWKSTYIEMGMFDEEFRGAVDTEFFFRAENSRIETLTVEDAIVSVRLPKTCGEVFRRQRGLCYSQPELEARSTKIFKSRKILFASFLRAFLSTFGLATSAGRYRFCSELGGLIGRLEGLRDFRRRKPMKSD